MSDESADVVDVARAAEQRSQAPEHDPGWYANPDGPGQRYYDGEKWTDSYHPSEPGWRGGNSTKALLWGLSLGFGVTGAVGIIAIPILAFYFPLGFGMGGIALAVAAYTTDGDTPWWAWLAVAASIAALISGGSAYSDFNDASSAADDVFKDLTLP